MSLKSNKTGSGYKLKLFHQLMLQKINNLHIKTETTDVTSELSTHQKSRHLLCTSEKFSDFSKILNYIKHLSLIKILIYIFFCISQFFFKENVIQLSV